MNLTEYLNALDFDELVELSLKQEGLMTKLRGYSSGIEERHLRTFDKKTLIRCFRTNEQRLNKHGMYTLEEE